MMSSRTIASPIFVVLLTMITALVSSATALVEVSNEIAEIPTHSQSPFLRESTATMMRFLRGGDINGVVDNEDVNDEERVSPGDKLKSLNWV
ncbi:Putative RxLR effector [Phytophthora palmivora]|uniref:RxLR effector n=1 Tax=Phytophthora palmivora TaxID=4796 RepID=A0A2P4WZP6_9STRA|nr:Putative RxLR effector [Phytophthora palmivora]